MYYNKNRSCKKKRRSYRKSVKGGWNEDDATFIEYKSSLTTYLGELENKLKTDLITYSNNRYSTNFTNVDEIIQFIKSKRIPIEQLQDDLNYEYPKYSVIPMGTSFYKAQRTPVYQTHPPLWLDYTGTIGNPPFSFVTDKNNRYTQLFLNKTREHFGNYIVKYALKEDLVILHLPLYITSFSESRIRHICTHMKSSMCADGYTCDYLTFNPNPIYKNLPSLPGFRELCIVKPDSFEPDLSFTIRDLLEEARLFREQEDRKREERELEREKQIQIKKEANKIKRLEKLQQKSLSRQLRREQRDMRSLIKEERRENLERAKELRKEQRSLRNISKMLDNASLNISSFKKTLKNRKPHNI